MAAGRSTMTPGIIGHYSMHPVWDESGKCLGIVHDDALFEPQQVELTAQAGRMVGVEKKHAVAIQVGWGGYPRHIRS
jgi:hypothetical protein